jgi:hypothetical protein
MTRRITRAFALAALLVFLCSSASAQTTRLQEFPFAVGVGGSAVNDTGRPADVKAFSTGGWHAFGEVVLEPGVILQFRYMNFSLPGTPVFPPFGVGAATSAPDVRVNAGLASMGYLFREPWWDAGLFGGVGVYGLNPKTRSGDQTSTDVKETVIGWHAGLVTAFHVAAHWDLRVEAAAYLLGKDANHKLITLGGSVAYHF